MPDFRYIARELSGKQSEGTLTAANEREARQAFAGCVLVSDNESWIGEGRGGSTKVLTEWTKFAARQKRMGVAAPKLVCIDVQPYTTTQAPERDDVLNVGGFSDAVFDVVAAFLGDGGGFVDEVEATEI